MDMIEEIFIEDDLDILDILEKKTILVKWTTLNFIEDFDWETQLLKWSWRK